MADRTYSRAFEINRAAPAFSYIEDPTLNDGSGAWRPLRSSDFAGGGGSPGDNTPVVVAIASGNAALSSINAPAAKAYTSDLSQNLLAKGSSGILFAINGYNSYTGVQYLHVYDNINSGANLISTVAVEGANNFSLDFGSKGVSMPSGIFACNSLTPVAQTNGGNDFFLTITYK